jgi:deoxyribodipyrimidine photo-lyase
MQQSQRAASNPALEHAVDCANRLGLPVVVGFGLTDGYPEANARHYAFMLEGLQETHTALGDRGIAFVMRRASPDDAALELAGRAALVVCDRGYLRHQKLWRLRVAQRAGCRVVQVEGDVVVPVALVSDKRETAARTIRPKLLRHRDEYLKRLRRRPVAKAATRLDLPPSLDLSDVPALLAQLDIDHSVRPVSRFRGGTAEALRRLRTFVRGPLERYAETRGEPAAEQVSFLAPYLHFGHISVMDVARAVAQSAASDPHRAAYLEELIVRRELAMNFVENEPDYDRYACIPSWARDTLERHRRDPRPYTYDEAELAAAATHDPYWNAAMREMRESGYMHNHRAQPRARAAWARGGGGAITGTPRTPSTRRTHSCTRGRDSGNRSLIHAAKPTTTKASISAKVIASPTMNWRFSRCCSRRRQKICSRCRPRASSSAICAIGSGPATARSLKALLRLRNASATARNPSLKTYASQLRICARSSGP